MRVIDISSDMVRVFAEHTVETFARNWVETSLSPRLVSLYREHPTDQILVLNGPGGFTNLRVWSLALSLLNALTWAEINFYSITKIDLYMYLVDKGFLPSQWAIYLGQKHNVWRYDFTQSISTQLRLDSLPVEQDVPYFVDFVSDSSYWWEHVSYMVDISPKADALHITFVGNSLDIPFENLMKDASPVVVPQYFVDAI